MSSETTRRAPRPPRQTPATGAPVRDWRCAAVCRDVDPEVFFPTAESGPVYEAQVAAATAVCAGCPVRPECLGFALAALPEGIAGGLTPAQRRAVRATRPRRGPRAPNVVDGVSVGASRPQLAAAGRPALAAGHPIRLVACEFGVTEPSVYRWAGQLRAGTHAEGSHGGNRAPLLISHAHHPQQGSEQRKGHRE